MRARPLGAALAASVIAAAPVAAQTPQPGTGTPRNGVFINAISNSIYAAVLRQGQPAIEKWVPLAAKLDEQIAFEINKWDKCMGKSVANWHQKGWKLAWCAAEAVLPWPFQIGEPGGRGNTAGAPNFFGGSGADSGWQPNGDCGDLAANFDAQGNLIIPATVLPMGKPVMMWDGVGPKPADTSYSVVGGTNGKIQLFDGSPWTAGGAGWPLFAGSRRTLHNANMQRMQRDWAGALKATVNAGGTPCVSYATVAYVRPDDGVIVGRQQGFFCESNEFTHMPEDMSYGSVEQKHHPCPAGQGGSGDFHFYGDNSWNIHFHNCVWYSPALKTADGYAINSHTTVPYWDFGRLEDWLPDHLKKCYINKELLRKVADELWKKAALQPGYAGPPYTGVKPEDVKPGDVTVNDLGAPMYDKVPTAPSAAPAPTPPQEPVKPETPEGPGSDILGPDPQVQLMDPTAPTGIMDPVFNWLPNLETLKLATNGAACPVWAIDLTGFSPGWSWTMESHCSLLEQQRAAIGALMIALFGISAALIILRA